MVAAEPSSRKVSPARVGAMPGDTPYGWDWSSTTHEGTPGIVDDLLAAMGTHVALETNGLQGWSAGVQSYDRGGYLLGTVYYGGGRDDVHVQSTSQAAHEVRPRILGIGDPRTARVDSRVDTLVPFDDLAWMLEDAGSRYGSQVTRYETVKGIGAKRGPGGRTIYLGAPSSAIRVRVYEKWLEAGTAPCRSEACGCGGEHYVYREGTNRVEVQLRPASKVKRRVSDWTPAETFCASRVTRDLAERLGDDLAPVNSLHVARPVPELEETLKVMGEQYGRKVDEWLRVSGGDLGTVLGHLLREHGPEDTD